MRCSAEVPAFPNWNVTAYNIGLLQEGNALPKSLHILTGPPPPLHVTLRQCQWCATMATSLMMTSAHCIMPSAKPTAHGTFSHIAEVGLALFHHFCINLEFYEREGSLNMGREGCKMENLQVKICPPPSRCGKTYCTM